MFINSARGGVVVEQEMIDAIDSGKISWAYLDVLTDEYPDLNTHPLAGRDNVILTPHVAFYSQESARDGRLQCCADIRNYFTGNYDRCVFVPARTTPKTKLSQRQAQHRSQQQAHSGTPPVCFFLH